MVVTYSVAHTNLGSWPNTVISPTDDANHADSRDDVSPISPVPCRKVCRQNAHRWSKSMTLASILGLKDTWNQQWQHHCLPKHVWSILSKKLKSSKRNAGRYGSLIDLVFRYTTFLLELLSWFSLSPSYRKQWRIKVLINCFNRRGRTIHLLILHLQKICSYRCVRLILAQS